MFALIVRRLQKYRRNQALVSKPMVFRGQCSQCGQEIDVLADVDELIANLPGIVKIAARRLIGHYRTSRAESIVINCNRCGEPFIMHILSG